MTTSGADVIDDGIDEPIWMALKTIILAAWAGNLVAVRSASMRLGDIAGVDDDRPVVYAYYLLRSRVYEVFRRVPTEDDLDRLVSRAFPKVSVLLRLDQGGLRDLLLDVFDKLENGNALKGYRFVYAACVTFGVLSNDPDIELARIRPKLASWYKRMTTS